jgi:hypothetical protein
MMALQTLLDEASRRALLERLHRVRSDARPLWGSLDAPRMVCHLADQLRVALGELPSKPVHNWLSRTLVKHLVVNTTLAAPRGKVRTAPEMLSTPPTGWEADLAACEALVERVARGTARGEHPMFGPLSPQEWGRLCWKHMDHHLVQFGV